MSQRQTVAENRVLDLLTRRIVGIHPDCEVRESKPLDDDPTLAILEADMRRYFQGDPYNRQEVGHFCNRLHAVRVDKPVQWLYPVEVDIDCSEVRARLVVTVEVE